MAARITGHHEAAANYKTYAIELLGDFVTTTVTWDPDVIADWIQRSIRFLNHSRDPPVVGMAAQWYFHPCAEPAATLQLAVGRFCLIIQLLYCPYLPYILLDFLWDDRITFVGIWNHEEAYRLEELGWDLLFQTPPIHLRNYVKARRGRALHRASFEAIVRECIGYSRVRLEWAISVSYWEVLDLSEDQVRYATTKAYASLLIGRRYRVWEMIRNWYDN